MTATLSSAQTSTKTLPQPTISYQAHLHSADAGKPVDGNVTLSITLYSDESGSTPLWSDQFQTLASNGIIDLSLGSNRPLPAPDVLDRVGYIGVAINGQRELRPLTRVSAVPRALSVTDGAITNSKLAPNSVTADKLDANYIAKVKLNGKEVSGKGATLNIISGDGINASYNTALDAIVLSTSKIIGFVATDPCSNNNDGSVAENTISGGCQNNASAASYGTIGGGESNTVSASYTTVGGGTENSATGNYATAAGGKNNDATVQYSSILGGQNNTTTAQYAAISGGSSHTVDGDYSFVGGGLTNKIDNAATSDTVAAYSAILGGRNNEITGKRSSILGGSHLKMGNRSLGFNSTTSTSTSYAVDVSSTDDIGYFGNIDLWLGNTGGTARSMRFYEDNASTTSLSSANYTALKAASSMSSDVTYTLPSAAPGSSGAMLTSTTGGTMSWVTDPTTGTGAANRVAFWNGASTLSSDADLYYDNTNDRLGMGTTSPSATLHVAKSVSDAGAVNGVTIAQSLTSTGNAALKGLYVNPTFSSSGDKVAIEAAGNVRVAANSSTEGELQFKNVAGTVTGFKSAASSTAATYTLPTAAPSTDKYLKSDNSGNLSWDTPSGGGGSAGWALTGNSGTTPGSDFLGTTDNQAFEIHVNDAAASSGGNDRVMRYEPKTNSANIIGGHNNNSVTSAEGSTIAGGGTRFLPNTINDDFGFIGGGSDNTISGGGQYSSIPGGIGLESQSQSATIVGQYNDPYGNYSGGAATTGNTGPLFLVGNGTASNATSNAFSVSAEGYARDYKRIGDAGPAPVTNGIYEDNQIIAWGVVQTNGAGGTFNPIHEFGVTSAVWGPVGFPANCCVITLSNSPGIATHTSSVTATPSLNCNLGSNLVPAICMVLEDNAQNANCTGSLANLGANQIAVFTYAFTGSGVGGGAIVVENGNLGMVGTQVPFNFKVTGRSESIPR